MPVIEHWKYENHNAKALILIYLKYIRIISQAYKFHTHDFGSDDACILVETAVKC